MKSQAHPKENNKWILKSLTCCPTEADVPLGEGEFGRKRGSRWSLAPSFSIPY